MLAMRQIIENPQEVIVVPPEFRNRPIEVIFMTIDSESVYEEDEKSLHGTVSFDNYPCLTESEQYESQVDALLELIDRFTQEEGSGDIYFSVVEKVISDLKKTDSPEERENVTNAWEFLGVIKYYSSDHGLYDFTISTLEGMVGDAIDSLPFYERFFLLTYNSDCFDWGDFKNDGKADLDYLIRYIMKDEPYFDAVKRISNYIFSQVPWYDPDAISANDEESDCDE
jgi:hypothetical protein